MTHGGDMKTILPLQPPATSAPSDVPTEDVPTVIVSFWLEKSFNIIQPISQSNTTVTTRHCPKVPYLNFTTAIPTITLLLLLYLSIWIISGLLLLVYTHQVHTKWVYKPSSP